MEDYGKLRGKKTHGSFLSFDFGKNLNAADLEVIFHKLNRYFRKKLLLNSPHIIHHLLLKCLSLNVCYQVVESFLQGFDKGTQRKKKKNRGSDPCQFSMVFKVPTSVLDKEYNILKNGEYEAKI